MDKLHYLASHIGSINGDILTEEQIEMCVDECSKKHRCNQDEIIDELINMYRLYPDLFLLPSSHINGRENRLLTALDMVITDKSPRLKYRPRSKEEKTAVHWGQRKLLISEIQFLTLFMNIDNPIIVYAGAAPGIHIPYLSQLFPMCVFHLYDPAPFAKGVHNGKTIFTYTQLFTDDDAIKWENRNDIFFISDIRVADYRKMEASEVEESISTDMQYQEKWYNIIKPVSALLKFRLPWPDRWHSPTYKYLDGVVFKQTWAPQSSTEGRLVPSLEKTFSVQKEWDIQGYEEAMFYHNTIVRDKFIFIDPITENSTKGLNPPELLNDYDSMAEVSILYDYLMRYSKDTLGKTFLVHTQETRDMPFGSRVSCSVSKDIVDMSRTITEELNKNIQFHSKWKTLDKIRKGHFPK